VIRHSFGAFWRLHPFTTRFDMTHGLLSGLTTNNTRGIYVAYCGFNFGGGPIGVHREKTPLVTSEPLVSKSRPL